MRVHMYVPSQNNFITEVLNFTILVKLFEIIDAHSTYEKRINITRYPKYTKKQKYVQCWKIIYIDFNFNVSIIFVLCACYYYVLIRTDLYKICGQWLNYALHCINAQEKCIQLTVSLKR